MRALAFALVILTTPTAALADAISHPPADCAEGSEGIRCHGAPTCRPVACTTDAECGEGRACQERSLCIERHCCGGRTCYSPTGQNEEAFSDHVGATCANGAACAAGTCESRRVCVPAEDGDEPSMNEPAMTEPAMTDPPPAQQTQTEETEDESCSASSTAGGGLVLTALVALALASRQRRQR